MKSLMKARDLYHGIARETPQDLKARRDLVLIAGRIGNVYLDKHPPEPDKALPFYEEALRAVEPLVVEYPLDAELQRIRAFVLTTLGDVNNELGRAQVALEQNARALEVLVRLREADDADRLAPVAVAFALNGRGKSHLLLGQYREAMRDLSEAEAIVRHNSGTQLSDMAGLQLLPGLVYANLARAELALASQASSAGQPASRHIKNAKRWFELARTTIRPLTTDTVEGERAKRALSDLEAVMASVPAASEQPVLSKKN
jgi:tetratricopeptide (TPR) repeat protein